CSVLLSPAQPLIQLASGCSYSAHSRSRSRFWDPLVIHGHVLLAWHLCANVVKSTRPVSGGPSFGTSMAGREFQAAFTKIAHSFCPWQISVSHESHLMRCDASASLESRFSRFGGCWC